jgi:hypothetical protein
MHIFFYKHCYLNLIVAEILFVAATLNMLSMLRHEATAADETDASCLSMTAVSKRLQRKRGYRNLLALKLLFKKKSKP